MTIHPTILTPAGMVRTECPPAALARIQRSLRHLGIGDHAAANQGGYGHPLFSALDGTIS